MGGEERGEEERRGGEVRVRGEERRGSRLSSLVGSGVASHPPTPGR
jgi:hypothetical protein